MRRKPVKKVTWLIGVVLCVSVLSVLVDAVTAVGATVVAALFSGLWLRLDESSGEQTQEQSLFPEANGFASGAADVEAMPAARALAELDG